MKDKELFDLLGERLAAANSQEEIDEILTAEFVRFWLERAESAPQPRLKMRIYFPSNKSLH